jgi:hypothetical protein
MKILLRAVVTGFGLSLGSALYKKAAKRLGFLDEEDKKDAAKEEKKVNQQDGATDPNLQEG